MRLQCPRKLSDSAVIQFISECSSVPETCEKLIIDFSYVDFALPYATLILANGLKQEIERRSTLGLATEFDLKSTGARAPGYLMHMGFFRYIGVDYGRDPNEAAGGANYLPITVLNRQVLESKRTGNLLQEVIDKESERLAIVLLGEENICESIMLGYCLREVIRNVFEHAATDSCLVMAQKHPQKSSAEIAIVDNGIGIYESLRKTHAVACVDDAIEKALLPGISCVAESPSDSRWSNSGFGLYIISSLGAEYGSFCISSAGRTLEAKRSGSKWGDTPVQGTAIKLRLRTDNAEYFPKILKQLVDNGEAATESIVGKRKSASKGTKTVSNVSVS